MLDVDCGIEVIGNTVGNIVIKVWFCSIICTGSEKILLSTALWLTLVCEFEECILMCWKKNCKHSWFAQNAIFMFTNWYTDRQSNHLCMHVHRAKTLSPVSIIYYIYPPPPLTKSCSYCHSRLLSLRDTYCPLSASSRSEGQKNSLRCMTAAIMKGLTKDGNSATSHHFKSSQVSYSLYS